MDDPTLWREIVIFIFTLWMTLWLGHKAYSEIREQKTKGWKVVVWILLLAIHAWTVFSIAGSWGNESLVNGTVPLSAYAFYDGVLTGFVNFWANLWNWFRTR